MTSVQMMNFLQLILHRFAVFEFFSLSFHYLDAHTYRWVEFTKKSVAKRVAKMLNGEQIGTYYLTILVH